MVKGAGKSVRHSRNLLQTMDGAAEKEGPLKWLGMCRIERKRVKVKFTYFSTNCDLNACKLIQF